MNILFALLTSSRNYWTFFLRQPPNFRHLFFADGLDRIGSSKSKSVPDKDLSSIYSDQAAEPYFLGDSLYYGGRDHYAHSSSAQGPVNPDTYYIEYPTSFITWQIKQREKFWCQTRGPVTCMHGMFVWDPQTIHPLFPVIDG